MQKYMCEKENIRIKRWLSLGLINTGCNLKCSYCYLQHHESCGGVLSRDYDRSVEDILSALSPERMGGICMYNMCADGETLITPHIEEIAYGLLEMGHYVSIVTNATVTKVINQMVGWPIDLRERLVFKCSLHWMELKTRKMLDLFSSNIKKLKENQISFSVECVACDELLESINDIKEYCIENFGALPHILTGRSERVKGQYRRFGSILSDEEYHDCWSQFDSDLFEYQFRDFDKNCNKYFCHGGQYTALINLNTGNVISCPGNDWMIANIYEDLTDVVHFLPVGRTCPLESCFMGHVFNELGGDYADEYDAGFRFSQFRDRICSDGSHWLTDKVRDVYEHLIKDQHECIEDDRKNFLSVVTKRRIGQSISNEETQKAVIYLDKCLKKRNIRNVAIYGIGNLGKWLSELMENTDILIRYGIDQNASQISMRYPVVVMDNAEEEVDAIIVSVYYHFSEIQKLLHEKMRDVKIISIMEI